jgi:hypothetical protein
MFEPKTANNLRTRYKVWVAVLHIVVIVGRDRGLVDGSEGSKEAVALPILYLFPEETGLM